LSAASVSATDRPVRAFCAVESRIVTVPVAIVDDAAPLELPLSFLPRFGETPPTPEVEAETLTPLLSALHCDALCRSCVISVAVTRLFLDGSAALASAAPVSDVVPPTVTLNPPAPANSPDVAVTDW
jgi:hypothetical protein